MGPRLRGDDKVCSSDERSDIRVLAFPAYWGQNGLTTENCGHSNFSLAQNQISGQIWPVKWIFDNFTKLFGLLSFCLIAAATIYDWAYFNIIGSQFRSIQTTYDYLAQAIEWVPRFLLASAVGAILGISLSTIATRGETGLSGQRAQRWRKHRLAGLFLNACFAAASLTVSLYLPYPTSLQFVVGGLLFLAVAVWTSSEDLLSIRAILLLGIAIVAMIYLSGVSDGLADSTGKIEKSSNVHSLLFKQDAAERQVLLLRSFEKGILIRTPSDRIEFVRWDQIEKLSHRVGMELEPSGCRLLHYFCSAVITP